MNEKNRYTIFHKKKKINNLSNYTVATRMLIVDETSNANILILYIKTQQNSNNYSYNNLPSFFFFMYGNLNVTEQFLSYEHFYNFIH